MSPPGHRIARSSAKQERRIRFDVAARYPLPVNDPGRAGREKNRGGIAPSPIEPGYACVSPTGRPSEITLYQYRWSTGGLSTYVTGPVKDGFVVVNVASPVVKWAWERMWQCHTYSQPKLTSWFRICMMVRSLQRMSVCRAQALKSPTTSARSAVPRKREYRLTMPCFSPGTSINYGLSSSETDTIHVILSNDRA